MGNSSTRIHYIAGYQPKSYQMGVFRSVAAMNGVKLCLVVMRIKTIILAVILTLL